MGTLSVCPYDDVYMPAYMSEKPGFTVVEIVHNWPAETFIQRHVRALYDVDFPVHVIARHALDMAQTSASSEFEGDSTIDAELMPNFNHLTRFGKIINLRHITRNSLFSKTVNAISERVLLGYFERLSPDLIHFHDAVLAASMCWIPQTLGLPYTLSIRGSDIQVFLFQSPDEKEKIVHALEQAAGIHTVCQDLGRQASELVGREIKRSTICTTVPLPSSIPDWTAPEDGGEIRFVSSGRLVWQKGFNNLLVALKHLRDCGMDARLTLIGVGPDLGQLLYMRKMLNLENYVDFPGKLDHEQIKTIFQNSHAYIQSSVTEGLSNSLVEAMANGLPIFATDVGGTREVIENGITGFLLQPHAPQDWLERLLLVRDGVLMERIRVSAHEKVKQLFSADCHAREFMAFYQSIIVQ